MLAVGGGDRLGDLEICTDSRSNLQFAFVGSKVGEGESFCILLLWYCVIACAYGWRVASRRSTVGVGSPEVVWIPFAWDTHAKA